MSAASSIINIVGPHELAILGDPDDTKWMDEWTTWTNFSYNVVKVESNAGNNYATSKTFTGHGNGDLLSTVYLEMLTPALTTNGGTAAHYVNSVGFAAIDTVTFKNGTQQTETKHGRWMEAIIEMCNAPGQRYEELVGKFESEIELIQFAGSDNRIIVPLLLSQTLWLHNAIPIISLHHSSVSYTFQFFDVGNLVNNVGNASASPYKYGTTTAIANADIQVAMYMTNIFLDDCERALFICSDLKYVITQTQEHKQSVTTANVESQIQGFSVNHPIKYGMWMFQMDDSIDGTTYTQRSVGAKDRFDYSASHGGESVSDCKWSVNNQQIWGNEDVCALYLRQVRAKEAFPYPSSKNVYIWNFGPCCNEWNAVKTVNFSVIDQTKFQFRNNNTAVNGLSGVGTLYFYVENINCYLAYGGVGGTPFGS